MSSQQESGKKTVLYVYAMTCDTNFAPCIADGWLTLACCKGGKKGGMRKSAGDAVRQGNDVWILGLRSKALDAQKAYRPVYLAQLDSDILDMQAYYIENGKAKGRADDVYRTDKHGQLQPVNGNPHEAFDDAMEKDRNGRYVLSSHHFIYWGNEEKKTDTHIVQELETLFPDIFERIQTHARGYLVDRDIADFSCEAAKWFGSEQVITFGGPISSRFEPSLEDNDETETYLCCVRGQTKK